MAVGSGGVDGMGGDGEFHGFFVKPRRRKDAEVSLFLLNRKRGDAKKVAEEEAFITPLCSSTAAIHAAIHQRVAGCAAVFHWKATFLNLRVD